MSISRYCCCGGVGVDVLLIVVAGDVIWLW